MAARTQTEQRNLINVPIILSTGQQAADVVVVLFRHTVSLCVCVEKNCLVLLGHYTKLVSKMDRVMCGLWS